MELRGRVRASLDCNLWGRKFYLEPILQREWIGVSEGKPISLEPVTITRTSSLIGTLSLEVDFNRIPK